MKLVIQDQTPTIGGDSGSLPPVTLELAALGPMGPPGPPGADGAPGTGGDSNFVFTQAVPASVWLVVHNLGKYPAPTVFNSANDVVEGDIEYIDLNSFTVTFGAPFSGKVVCN